MAVLRIIAISVKLTKLCCEIDTTTDTFNVNLVIRKIVTLSSSERKHTYDLATDNSVKAIRKTECCNLKMFEDVNGLR